MMKWVFSFSLLIITNLLYGKTPPLYQIDVIVFTHPTATLTEDSTVELPPLQGIPLKLDVNKAITPYHLLPSSLSQLQGDYWVIHHKLGGNVLFHYSWLQPSNNQKAVIIPKISRNGWTVEGSFRVRRSNYYLLDTNLVFAAEGIKSSFVFAPKQRLKGNSVYYIDHPQAGIFIKVHSLA